MAKKDFDLSSTVELHFEDEGFQPKLAVASAKELLSLDKVDLLVVFGANQSAATAPLAESAGITLIAISVLETVLMNRKYITTFLPTTQRMMKSLANHIRVRRYRNVATVATQQDACLLQVKHLKDLLEGRIHIQDSFVPTEADFRTTIRRIKRSQIDSVSLSMIAPQGSLFAKQLREAGYQGAILTGLQTANFSELEAARGALTWAVGITARIKNGGGKNHSRSRATARIFAPSIFQKMRQGFPHIATGIFVTRSKYICRKTDYRRCVCV